ncbi:MAG TPA: CehA/McbA family metallohydrolase [Woeseiaceae bacterium]|nr:CehA/McbA family metallohydrolase [Woeseiaceae bacterium]
MTKQSWFARPAASIPGLAIVLMPSLAAAGWDYRYPKVDDYAHHVYLEQHEFPFLSSGPVDPAPSPDGKSIAFASQGWLWLLDLDNGVAVQLTDSPAIDGRPRWSPDGRKLAFVRDGGLDTSIVIRDLENGNEEVVDSPAIELDPEFSADGKLLYYTSARNGVLSIWRRDLASGHDEQMTDLRRTERNARRLPGGHGLLYLNQAYPIRNIHLRDFVEGSDRIVRRTSLSLAMSFDVHPAERSIVLNMPAGDDYHVIVADIEDPVTERRLTPPGSYALTPAFSADGTDVYYVTPDSTQQFRLMRVPTVGGTPREVDVREWRYADRTGELTITTTDENGKPVPARISLRRSDGHPIATADGPTYLDPQHGYPYFYSPGTVTLSVPDGRYDVLAVRGPLSMPVSSSARVRAGKSGSLDLSVKRLWDARTAGYLSADQHVHLNADGVYRMTLADTLPLLAGEDLDQLFPMSWNRLDRYVDEPLIGERLASPDGYAVHQSQEVRSNFHGHVGMIGAREAFHPWFFGPNMPRFGSPDRSNGEAMAFAGANNILATYVHPIALPQDPFDNLEANPIPLELVSDGVLTDNMGIELVCMWINPLGVAEVWYRLLNIGQRTVATSGTDMFTDFQRTPAAGTARLYAEAPGGRGDIDSILSQVRAGRTFLTTGPALLFSIGTDARPGDVTSPGEQPWTLTLISSEPVDVVEIVVNGEVVEQLDGIRGGETKVYEGTVSLPANGWVAARAHGGAGEWPSMAVDQFAHSSPVWIGAVGSRDPEAANRAAADLIRAIDFSAAEARDAYGETPTPRLDARFAAAREKLEALLQP